MTAPDTKPSWIDEIEERLKAYDTSNSFSPEHPAILFAFKNRAHDDIAHLLEAIRVKDEVLNLIQPTLMQANAVVLAGIIEEALTFVPKEKK